MEGGDRVRWRQMIPTFTLRLLELAAANPQNLRRNEVVEDE